MAEEQYSADPPCEAYANPLTPAFPESPEIDPPGTPGMPLPIAGQTGAAANQAAGASHRRFPHIKNFEIIREIAGGGFGLVFEARQHEPKRVVALKVLKDGPHSRETALRFQQEQNALAKMSHPNIAKVYATGESEAGLPYFAMELIEGERWITRYCDDEKLTIPERLQLFIKVCRATQHAHQNAIIHRDIKPSNILVAQSDGSPEPKVIDFGIAKALDDSLIDRTLNTRPGQSPGTPAYMSPEQAENGKEIDTRSDIYSLGVVLYELLTGCHPLGGEVFESQDYETVKRRIREEDPRRPTSAVSSVDAKRGDQIASRRGFDLDKLRRLLRGDISKIVLKTLEKDRERRYDSAASLALDIEHYLNGEPVVAVSPSALYLASRYAKRHKMALVVGSTLLAVLFAATLISTSLYFTANNAKGNLREQLRRNQNQRAEQFIELNNNSSALLASVRSLRHTAIDDHVAIESGRRRVQMVLRQCPKPDGLWTANSAAHSVEFFPNGAAVAVALEDGRVMKYDIGEDKAEEIANFGNPVKSAAVSSDGETIVAAVEEPRAGVYSQNISPLGSAPIRFRNSDKANWVNVFLHGGVEYVVAAHAGGVARVWELSKPNAEPREFGGPVDSNQRASSADVSEEGNVLALAIEGSDGYRAAELFDFSSAQHQRSLSGHHSLIYTACLNRDGTRAVTASFDRSVRIWDTAKGVLLHKLIDDQEFNCAEFSPDGRFVATAGMDGKARLWNTKTGWKTSFELSHRTYLHDLAFSSSGDRIATCTSSGTLRTWDVSQFLAPYVRTAAVPAGDQHLAVLDANRGVLLRTTIGKPPPEGTPFLAIPPPRVDAQPVAVYANDAWDSGAAVFRTENPDVDYGFFYHLCRTATESVVITKFRPVADSARRYLWFANDRDVLKLDTQSDTPALLVESASENVERLAINAKKPDQFAIGGRTEVWLHKEGSLIGPLPRPVATDTMEINHLAFNADGTMLGAAYKDNRMRASEACVWDTRTGKRLPGELAHSDGVLCLAFEPEKSQRLATGGEDKTARVWVWDEGKWKLEHVLAHTGNVTQITFSAEGTMIATVSKDGNNAQARVWEVASGTAISPPIYIRRHDGDRTRLAFSSTADAVVIDHASATTVIDISQQTGTLDELESLAKLLNGQRLQDDGALLPLSHSELTKTWSEARASFPDILRP